MNYVTHSYECIEGVLKLKFGRSYNLMFVNRPPNNNILEFLVEFEVQLNVNRNNNAVIYGRDINIDTESYFLII